MMKGMCIAAFAIVALAGCTSLESQQALNGPAATTATDARAIGTGAVSPGRGYNRSFPTADPFSDYPDLPQTPF
jgi:hypothetical protein